MRNIAVMVIVLAAAFAGQTDAAGVQGGIVAVKDGTAVYCDLQTKETTALTAPDVKIKGSFSISEDGKTLMWADRNKLYAQRLPSVTPHVVKIKEGFYEKGRTTPLDSIIPLTLKNLDLSPNGTKFSYEYKRERSSAFGEWFFEAGDVAELAVDFSTHQPWLLGNEGVIGGMQEYMEASRNGLGHESRIFWNARKGGPCQWAGPWQSIDPNDGGAYMCPVVWRRDGRSGHLATLTMSDADMIARNSVEHNVHFIAFSKDSEAYAFIYQTKFGWGPIEIRTKEPPLWRNRGRVTIDTRRKDELRDMKPGIYRIAVQLKNCYGLAWSNKGLSIVTDGNGEGYNGESKNALCLYPNGRIGEGIAKSGIGSNPDFGKIWQATGAAPVSAPVGVWVHDPTRNWHANNFSNFVAINNVFNISPSLVANIDGKQVCWVSDTAFLYRNNNGMLCVWENGTVEKIGRVPEDWKWCLRPPTPQEEEKTTPEQVVQGTPNSPRVVPFKEGVDITSNGPRVSFEIGDIRLSYSGRTSFGENTFGFVHESTIFEGELEELVDPTMLRYEKNRHHAALTVNKILVLRKQVRYGYSYAALKILKTSETADATSIMPVRQLEFKWRFWENIPRNLPRIRVVDKPKRDLAKAGP